MSKTSKKRGFSKIFKWGKFLKPKRSKKTEKKTIFEEEKLEQHDELNKTTQDQETTALIIEKTTEINVPELKEEAKKLEEEIESANCSLEDQKASVKVDLCQKFDQDATSNGGGSSSHVLGEGKTDLDAIEVFNESEVKQNNDNDLQSVDNLDNGNSLSKDNDLSLVSDQVLDVVVHTPSPEQPRKQDNKISNNEDKDEELAFPILPIPSSKIKKSDYKTQKPREEKKNAFDEDDVFVAAAVSTPPQKRPENRESRVLTVKKIRSIIATPYKRLKREGSLLDGQTYRYIEIQSLVNAFQSMHPCIGSMIACNEKGLQYGKSSVLRIECKECNTKVFLQASKN